MKVLCCSLSGIVCLIGLISGVLAGPDKTEEPPKRVDRAGDVLPDGALARLGTVRLRTGYATRDAVFSGDGKQLFSVARDGVVRAWDTDSGKEVRSFASRASRFNAAGIHKFAPDAATMVMNEGWEKGVWDTKTGKAVCERQDYKPQFISDVVSPDGKIMAGLDRGDQSVVHLVDFNSEKESARLEGYDHKSMYWTLVFSPNGKYVAAWSEKTVQIWSVATGKAYWKINTPEKRSTAPVFSADSSIIALGTADKRLYFWDVESRKELGHWQTTNEGTDRIALSRDGKFVATSSNGHESIDVWNVSSGKQVVQVPKPAGPWDGYPDVMNSLGFCFSPDAKSLAVWSHSLTLWDLATGKEKRFGDGREDSIRCLTFTPDGHAVISGGHDRTIRLWDADSGRELHRFAEKWQAPVQLAVTPDGKQLIAFGDGPLGSDPAIKRWDLKDYRSLQATSLGGLYHSSVAPVTIMLEGKDLLVAGNGDIVSFWDLAARKEVKQLDRATFPDAIKVSNRKVPHTIRSIVVSPDGKILAIGGYNGVDIWDIRTEKVIGHWNRLDQRYQNQATALAFHPDGRSVFVAWSEIGPIELRELSTGTVVGRLEDHEGPPAGLLEGFEGRRTVHKLVVSPDGHSIASAERDGTVRLWELATEGARTVFKGHRGPVFTIAFSADGKRLVSGSSDTTALIWDLGRNAVSTVKPSTAESAELAWKRLRDGNASDGERAIRSLLATPETTLEMLRRNLKPLARADEKQLARWLADLDSEEFKTREEATAQIEKLGLAVDARLRDALGANPSAELRHRLEDLLKPLNPDRIRSVRAIEVLEHLGASEAQDLLKNLARGSPDASLTREAAASLKRLEKH
jgi:WD40 repeat protein